MPVMNGVMSPQGSIEVWEEIVKLEVELHQPSSRKSRERLDELLHTDFAEIGRSGSIYTKQEIMSALESEQAHTVWSQDFEIHPIYPGLMLLTYRSAQVDANGNLSRFSRRSSLWEKLESGWKLRFHQGTPTNEFERIAT